MAIGQVDDEDAVLFGAFVLAIAVMAERATVGPFWDYTMSDVLVEWAGLEVTVALVIALGVLVGVYITNETDLDKLDTEYYVAAVATPAVLVLMAWVPEFQDFVTSSDIAALAFIGLAAAGYVAVSFFG